MIRSSGPALIREALVRLPDEVSMPPGAIVVTAVLLVAAGAAVGVLLARRRAASACDRATAEARETDRLLRSRLLCDSAGVSAADRLEHVDRLYAAGSLTALEHGAARARILGVDTTV